MKWGRALFDRLGAIRDDAIHRSFGFSGLNTPPRGRVAEKAKNHRLT